MRRWTSIERRARDAIFEAMIPRLDEGGPQGPPGLGELDLRSFWELLERSAPRFFRLGFRVAVWFVTLSPPFFLITPRLFSGLTPSRRDELLRRLSASRLYGVRQLVTILKAIACLAYLRDPDVRSLIDARSA